MRAKTTTYEIRDPLPVVMLAAALVILAVAVFAPAANAKPGGSTAGSVAINAGAAATGTTSVTLNSSMAGAVQMQFRNAGGSWSGWKAYSATYAWTLTAGDGVKTVEAQYKGTTGKPASRSDTIVLDTTAPALASLTSSSHPDEALWYADPDLSAEWTAGADLSGITGYSWVVDRVAGTVPDTVAEGSAAGLTVAGVGDGVWYVHVRAVDAVGNAGPVAHRALRVDTTAPTTSATAPAHPGRNLTVVLTAADVHSGVALVEYRIDGGVWTTGGTVKLSVAIKHRKAGLAVGDHLVEYRATDAAGNVETAGGVTVTLQ